MSAEVIHLTPHLLSTDCPDALKSLPGWLIWNLESVPGETKPRKIPSYANGGKRQGTQGSPADRAQLVTFAEARAAAVKRGFSGVGLAMLPGFGITAVDLDNVIGEDGAMPPEVEALTLNTYTEKSPSGRGLRAFVLGELGDRKSIGADYPFGIEIFSGKGYCTFTGDVTEACAMLGLENTVADPSLDLLSLLEHRFARPTDHSILTAPSDSEPLGLTPEQIATALSALDPDMPRHDWIQVGMGLHHETAGEGFTLWDEWSATGSKYPGSEELEKQWFSFDRPRVGVPTTARSLIRMANQQGAGIGVREPTEPSADDFDVIDPEPGRPRFSFQQAADFISGPAPTYIVQGLLPKADLAVVYGESGSGKTFWVLDLVMAIARGLPDWRGRKVVAGRVAYIAAEGAGGFKNRIKAYSQHHGLTESLAEIPFYVMGDSPNFLDDKTMREVLEMAKPLGGMSVIVVDTYASVMPGGNENSGEDAGRVVQRCKLLHQMTGALVILIHHSGKDASKGARGWSGLRAAADVEIEIVRAGGERCADITKLKDGDDTNIDFGFRLDVLTLDDAGAGDPVTSCVIVDTDAHAGDVRAAGSKRERRKDGAPDETAQVRDALQKLIGPGGGLIEASAALEISVETGLPENIVLRVLDKLERNGETVREHGLLRFTVPPDTLTPAP